MVLKEDSKTNQLEKEKEMSSSSGSNYVLKKLSIITDNLETYQGRDTVITLLHYIALIFADICGYYSYSKTGHRGKKIKRNKKMVELGENFVNMFVQLSNCRVMLRLFDDFNAIRDIYRFFKNPSTEKKNQHPYVKWVTVINLIFWVLYNPFEHLGWLAELKIINADDQLWYFYTNIAWAGGLFTSVLINIRVVLLYYSQDSSKSKREDDPKYDSSSIISRSEMQQSGLVAFRDFLDWCIAIHFMPPGFLWSAQLYHYQVGIIGVISSLCRVHTYVINAQN